MILFLIPKLVQPLHTTAHVYIKLATCLSTQIYVVCPKSKCTDFLFNYLLDLPEIKLSPSKYDPWEVTQQFQRFFH